MSNYKVVKPHQIIYTKSPLKQKPYGIIKANQSEEGIVSVLYAVYNALPGVCPDFIDRYFSPYYRTNNYLRPLINKGAKNTINITDEGALNGSLYLPSLSEQKEVAAYFHSLDELIKASAKKIDSLKKMKAGFMQTMFPQLGETMPKIRFKGFTGDWEKKALHECLDISTDKNDDNAFGIKDVLSVSDDYGVVNQIKHLGRSYAGKSVSNYGVLRTGEIVYTKSPLKSKPYGIVKLNAGITGIVSVLYAIYRPKDNVSAEYIHYYFDPAWRLNHYLRPLVNKGAKNTMNISDETALAGTIMLPKSLQEQQQIASFFHELDSQIRLHEQKLAKLKQIKASCLDKMFV